jgi:hypothetical protein
MCSCVADRNQTSVPGIRDSTRARVRVCVKSTDKFTQCTHDKHKDKTQHTYTPTVTPETRNPKPPTPTVDCFRNSRHTLVPLGWRRISLTHTHAPTRQLTPRTWLESMRKAQRRGLGVRVYGLRGGLRHKRSANAKSDRMKPSKHMPPCISICTRIYQQHSSPQHACPCPLSCHRRPQVLPPCVLHLQQCAASWHLVLAASRTRPRRRLVREQASACGSVQVSASKRLCVANMLTRENVALLLWRRAGCRTRIQQLHKHDKPFGSLVHSTFCCSTFGSSGSTHHSAGIFDTLRSRRMYVVEGEKACCVTRSTSTQGIKSQLEHSAT